MSKDPAVLFYTSDFLTGTLFFTMEQKGQYITLLCIQHQHGSIPENHMISVCGSFDNPVIGKFTKDDQGNYYNERMKIESEKRKSFCESRSNNKSGRPKKDDKNNHKKITRKSYDNHMENENENENRNISELLLNEILKRKPSFKKPDLRIWDTDVELMILKDNRSIEEIKKVIIWCQSNTFWQNNILSTTKLRKQFDQLSLKMEGEENASSRKGNSGSQQPAIKKTGNAQSDGQPYPEDRTY